MGTILKRLDFKQRYPNIRQGLFLVRNEKRLPKNQPIINIGRIVSEQLVNYPREKRAGKLPQIIEAGIGDSGAVSLAHIEVLFTDYLAFDVIRELHGLARNRKLCVLWPGEYQQSLLKYARPGSPEYYEFSFQELNDAYYVTD